MGMIRILTPLVILPGRILTGEKIMERTLCNLSEQDQLEMLLGRMTKIAHEMQIVIATTALGDEDLNAIAAVGDAAQTVVERLLDTI